ncbi:MAG: ABC transporter ATP-binding protein [Propionibacteriaceae bacterium]|nr:ABC transporter ATP-binding protein [Propionibacteriaceae bacterium]
MAIEVAVEDVTVRRGATFMLDHVSWAVSSQDRWVVIGPNGAGKTTLMRLLSARLFPTSGQVWLLGERLGAVDVFELRPRIGMSSSAIDGQIPADEVVLDVVLSAAYGIIGRWREVYGAADMDRATWLLDEFGVGRLANRSYGKLSVGERQRVMIARALMPDPELLILDEPTAGLDLAGRESLLISLSRLAADTTAPASVMVTHHVEEIPKGVTHALFLKQGRVVAAGPIDAVMTAAVLSRTFDMSLRVDQIDGRWRAQAQEA